MNVYTGIPAAEGIACALAVVVKEIIPETVTVSLDEAVEQCLKEIRHLREKTAADLGEESAEIFDAYEMLLQDQYLVDSIRNLHNEGAGLVDAVEQAMEQHAAMFARAKSQYMQQRADDIRNIKKMLQRALMGNSCRVKQPENGEKFVLFAETLSPADIMEADTSRLAGLVSKFGGNTSHAVILAKTLGIPAVTGFDALDQVEQEDTVVIDGAKGTVTVAPDEQTMQQTQKLLEEQEKMKEMMRQLPKGEVSVLDGEVVHVSVNIGLASDLEGLDLESIYGVGLYRTEFLFSERVMAPTVEEQIKEYKNVFDSLAGKDLIIRTLDIGGDKVIPYLDCPKEENPFLGCRGIRLCFRNESLLRDQFTALLTASEGRPFSVMFPMISNIAEFRKAKKIWGEIAAELKEKGCSISPDIRLGVMVETPAAAFCADLLAKEVDFASIGTNDLTQYVLAADRGNPSVGVKLSYYDPAVLRAIYQTISAFRQADVKISVCGEAGSDVHFLPLMLAMGLRYVSVSRSLIDRVRYTVLNTCAEEQKTVLQHVLTMATEEEVRAAVG